VLTTLQCVIGQHTKQVLCFVDRQIYKPAAHLFVSLQEKYSNETAVVYFYEM